MAPPRPLMKPAVFALIALTGATVPACADDAPSAELSFVERVRRQAPFPGGADALRRYIEGVGRNAPDLSMLEGEAAQEVRARTFSFSDIARLGAVRRVDFRGVEAANGFDIYRVTTANARSEWLVSMSPAGRISRIYWRALERPPAEAPTRDQFVGQVRERIAEMAGRDAFAGVVLIADHGEPILQAAFGLADRARGVPNRADTKFRVGSMNKMFTAVAIMQLVEQGRVRLDATVGDYIPDYPNRELASRVTVTELLTHTGATGDFFGPQFSAHRTELVELADYVELYGSRGLAYQELSERYAYSNYGFILLGRIIERVTGRPYRDFVRASILAPAGMDSTGFELERVEVPGRSVGYTRRRAGEAWVSNANTLPPRGISAGGGYSTAGDLLRFAEALHSNRLLSPTSTRLLTTGRIVIGEARYAFGFMEWRPDGTRWIGHSGGAPGMCGDLRIAPDRDFVIVVLSNMDPPACNEVAGFAEVHLPA
jgi:D-alanyl-D-alanine carboxypeptidase